MDRTDDSWDIVQLPNLAAFAQLLNTLYLPFTQVAHPMLNLLIIKRGYRDVHADRLRSGWIAEGQSRVPTLHVTLSLP